MVYKEEELGLMIELIENGIWSNKNLITALHVDEKTIIKWKKRPEALNAHRKAILKYVKRRTDVENVLKELDIDVITTPPNLVDNRSITVINYGGTTKQIEAADS